MDLNSKELIKFIADSLEKNYINDSKSNNSISKIKIDKKDTDFDYASLTIFTQANEKIHVLAFKVN